MLLLAGTRSPTVTVLSPLRTPRKHPSSVSPAKPSKAVAPSVCSRCSVKTWASVNSDQLQRVGPPVPRSESLLARRLRRLRATWLRSLPRSPAMSATVPPGRPSALREPTARTAMISPAHARCLRHGSDSSHRTGRALVDRKTRAGKPLPSRGFGQLATRAAPASGSPSRLPSARSATGSAPGRRSPGLKSWRDVAQPRVRVRLFMADGGHRPSSIRKVRTSCDQPGVWLMPSSSLFAMAPASGQRSLHPVRNATKTRRDGTVAAFPRLDVLHRGGGVRISRDPLGDVQDNQRKDHVPSTGSGPGSVPRG